MSTATMWADAIETHTSALFFAGDLAFKLKKPVSLGFLDYSTLEQRKAACQAEVELNRRLAPDVYLGVDDVIDAGGEVCEHLVVMRRMPASRRLSTLVERAPTSRTASGSSPICWPPSTPRPPGCRRPTTQPGWTPPPAGGSRTPPVCFPSPERSSTPRTWPRSTPWPAATSRAGDPCSTSGSPGAGPATGTATSWPRTSSSSTTGPGCSTAWSSTIGCATATSSPTSRS